MELLTSTLYYAALNGNLALRSTLNNTINVILLILKLTYVGKIDCSNDNHKSHPYRVRLSLQIKVFAHNFNNYTYVTKTSNRWLPIRILNDN